MAAFAPVDRALSKAVEDLHDYLWTGAKHDEAALLGRLEEAAGRLDRHVRAGGSIADSVRPLVKSFDRRAVGADLFTFLEIVSHLAGAVEVRTKDPKDATRRASETVVSNSIHLASAAGRFEIVEMFESGKSDFMTFQDRLADLLTRRGVVQARELQRAANAAYDSHAIWSAGWSKDVQQIVAVAAIGNAAHHASLLADALRSIGRYRDPPYGSLASAVRRILDRIGPQG